MPTNLSKKKSPQISKKRIFFTLILSLISAILATLTTSIYWPSLETERLFAAGMFAPLFLVLFMLMGFLASNTKRAVLWQVGLSLLLLALIAWDFVL